MAGQERASQLGPQAAGRVPGKERAGKEREGAGKRAEVGAAEGAV